MSIVYEKVVYPEYVGNGGCFFDGLPLGLCKSTGNCSCTKHIPVLTLKVHLPVIWPYYCLPPTLKEEANYMWVGELLGNHEYIKGEWFSFNHDIWLVILD